MKNQVRSCTICATPFDYVTRPGRPPVACSMTCKALVASTRQRYCSVPTCATPFTLDDPTASPPYFCSENCRAASKYSGRQCKYCREPIPSETDDGRNNFCNFTCITKASEGMQCAVCAQPVEVKANHPWLRVQRYCSTACREAKYIGLAPGANDNGDSTEAIAYSNAMVPTDLHNGNRLQLPTTASGGPYFKVRPCDLADDYLKQCSPQLRRGIKFREDQVIRICATHADKPYLPELLMQVGLLQYEEFIGRTQVPVDPSNKAYLPSLAEVFPWLSDQARFTLRKHGWIRRASLYYRQAPSRRYGKISRLEDNVRKELDKLVNDNFPKTPGVQTAFTRQCIKLWHACADLAKLYRPIDHNLYVPPQWIPELTYKEFPTPENDFQTVYGEIQELIIDESIKWLKAIPKSHKPTLADSGYSLWNTLLIQQPLDMVTFAYWFWKMNVDHKGQAIAWLYDHQRDFDPNEC